MARERVTRTNGTRTGEARGLDVADVRKLIRLLNRTDLSEITIENASGLKLTLRKPAPLALSDVASAPAAIIAVTEVAPADAEPAKPDNVVEVTSPMVGIFRSAMKRGAKPLLEIEAKVRKGQVIGAIESLNVYNEVEADTAGTVAEMLVHDGQAVEFGQPLVRIERVPA